MQKLFGPHFRRTFIFPLGAKSRDRCDDFKNIFPKKIAKKLAFFYSNKAKLCKILILTLVFEKNIFFRRKLAKIAESCDRNIDPRTQTISSPNFSPKKRSKNYPLTPLFYFQMNQPGADVEAFAFSPWLAEMRPKKSPYFPQIGDILMYFKQGHEKYVERARNTYKINQVSIFFVMKPTTVHGIRYHDPCVSGDDTSIIYFYLATFGPKQFLLGQNLTQEV
jgi:hypothetical protein